MKSGINKIRLLLVSCLAFALVAFGAISFSRLMPSAQAAGTTITSTEYTTDGSSIRIFRSASDTEATERTGLRFHVEMGNGYSYKGTPIVNTSATNDSNGAFLLNEGFKTYTLIIPTRLLNGELTVDTDKVMKLDTSNFWYLDVNGNLESIAYVYNIPNHRYTDNFSFRGIICDDNDNVIAQTPTSERCVAEIAKKSFIATNNGTENWGDDARKNAALGVLEGFIPTYSIVYQNANGETIDTENVMWGDAPQNAPVDDSFNAWFSTAHSEVVDVNNSMSYSKSETIVLTATKSTNFAITGVSDINDVAFGGNTYSGVKAYATLPQGEFPYDEEFDINAVNVEYQGSGSFAGLEKAFVTQEGIFDRLVLAFDSSSMVSGDKLIVKGDSAFYINGKMYQLTEDYTIDYFKDDNGVESYGVFLGYVYKSDIEEIRNYTEDRDGDPSNGEESKTIRITFHEDIFVNSGFTFEHDSLPSGYSYPAYIQCPQAGKANEIIGGYYYWNDGNHSILELQGYGNHNQDELFIAPGTKIVQNGGYYIFEDGLYAYYKGNGDGINQYDDEVWADGRELGTFNASSFELLGKNASDATEIRLNTLTRWFKNAYAITIENVSTTEPYTVYHTAVDGTITPVSTGHYFGQSYGEGYNHQILAFSGVEGTQAGETLTILAGTRFWVGNDFFSASEDVIAYYNGTKWIVGDDGQADSYVGIDDCAYDNWNIVEGGTYKTRIRFATEQFNGQATGSQDFPYLHVESGSVKVNGVAYSTLRYHGGHRIFEIVGDSIKPLGSSTDDKIVIEKGTRLWLNDFCLEFSEEVALVYVGNVNGGLRDGSGNYFQYEWLPANRNVNVTSDDVIRMYDATDAGGEVRISIQSGILTNNFYGYMFVDTTKGTPVVNGVEFTSTSFSYGAGNNLIAIRGGQCGEYYGNGASLYIPAGSVWYTTQGSITFTEDIVGVYAHGVWGAGINTTTLNDTITKDNVEYVYAEGTELRMRLSKELTGYEYYGTVALIGDVHFTKPNGTEYDVEVGFWYGGNTGYKGDHSLLGFIVNGLTSFENGTTITIPQGTKVAYQSAKGVYGYNEIGEDISYVYNGSSWVSATGYDVTFNFSNATVSVNGKSVQNGETIALFAGANTVAVTPANGYSVTAVTGGANNLDGTYTINVSNSTTITISTKQHIELDANAIKWVQNYDETAYGAELTGIRFEMVTDRVSLFTETTAFSWNGAIETAIEGGVYYSVFHAAPHNLLELRFKTANLKACDSFTIKAGTVFFSNGATYAFKWTEDVTCTYSGSQWFVKLGEIDWNTLVGRIYSYSDFSGDVALNHTIRINCNQVLYNSIFGRGTAISNVTINGVAYTSTWQYHGGGNEILEISEWNYKSGDTLVVPAGTKIFIYEHSRNGAYYYETVNTLTATCTADGSGAIWNWAVS